MFRPVTPPPVGQVPISADNVSSAVSANVQPWPMELKFWQNQGAHPSATISQVAPPSSSSPSTDPSLSSDPHSSHSHLQEQSRSSQMPATASFQEILTYLTSLPPTHPWLQSPGQYYPVAPALRPIPLVPAHAHYPHFVGNPALVVGESRDAALHANLTVQESQAVSVMTALANRARDVPSNPLHDPTFHFFQSPPVPPGAEGIPPNFNPLVHFPQVAASVSAAPAATSYQRHHSLPTDMNAVVRSQRKSISVDVADLPAEKGEKSPVAEEEKEDGGGMFVCSVCGASFTIAANMRRHEALHTGEKPFVCDFEGCGRAFARKYDLKVHYRTHTRERPYTCEFPECGKKFSRISSLREHERNMHQGQGGTKQKEGEDQAPRRHSFIDTSRGLAGLQLPFTTSFPPGTGSFSLRGPVHRQSGSSAKRGLAVNEINQSKESETSEGESAEHATAPSGASSAHTPAPPLSTETSPSRGERSGYPSSEPGRHSHVKRRAKKRKLLHAHRPGCGHKMIVHEGHADFIMDKYLHHVHGDVNLEHSLPVSDAYPAVCNPLDSHSHVHGDRCGHEMLIHEDHVDYIVGNELHHVHDGHCDSHGYLKELSFEENHESLEDLLRSFCDNCPQEDSSSPSSALTPSPHSHSASPLPHHHE